MSIVPTLEPTINNPSIGSGGGGSSVACAVDGSGVLIDGVLCPFPAGGEDLPAGTDSQLLGYSTTGAPTPQNVAFKHFGLPAVTPPAGPYQNMPTVVTFGPTGNKVLYGIVNSVALPFAQWPQPIPNLIPKYNADGRLFSRQAYSETPVEGDSSAPVLTTADVSVTPSGSKLPIRKADGNMVGPSPVFGVDYANKAYVDAQVGGPVFLTQVVDMTNPTPDLSESVFVPVYQVDLGDPLETVRGKALTLSYTALSNTIPVRNVSGQLSVSTPTLADHAAPKQYVDQQVGSRVQNLGGVAGIVKITQAAYDALATKVATTLYIIEG